MTACGLRHLLAPVLLLSAMAGLAGCSLLAGTSAAGSMASAGVGGSSSVASGSLGGGGDAPEGRLCGEKGISGEVIPAIEGPGTCGVPGAVRVSSVSGVALSPSPTVTCEAAKALNAWVRDTAAPAFSGPDLKRIDLAAHYVCPAESTTGPLAEHATGNAFDIAVLTLSDGTSITVAEAWQQGPHALTLQNLRSGACADFSSAAGPVPGSHPQASLHLGLSGQQPGTGCSGAGL